MRKEIVIGALFGDEGKGTLVQWLCRKSLDEGRSPLVLRFTGGPQAAHTVKSSLAGRPVTHVFASFGSGSLLGIPTLYRPSSMIDPICLKNEWEVLKGKCSLQPIWDVRQAPIITPYDVEANRNDAQNREDGTCGKGVYMAWKRTLSGLRFTLENVPEEILSKVAHYYRTERYASYDEMFTEAFEWARKENRPLQEGNFDDWIFESTQGLLLDADRGFLPHVTATSTGLNALDPSELDGANVYLVVRTYLTRHGNGYEPLVLENYDLCDEENETNGMNEFQGRFKTGLFDFDLLNEAFERHSLAAYAHCRFHLAITHLDVVSRMGRMAYLKGGEVHQLHFRKEDACESVARLFRENCALKFTSILCSDSPMGDFQRVG
ncbi:MAG: adenylosuccinate synthetase [Paludibacteraceae bacterium]|nr:adenylosuccinate synthetase [Paludibacteraceae bacterium]